MRGIKSLNMKNRIILIVAVILVAILGVVLVSKNKSDHSTGISIDEVVNAGDPIDPTMEFFNSWLDAVISTTTSPIEANLTSNEFLSESVRNYIIAAQADSARTVDPVLCQTITPKRVGAKVSFILDSKAQLLIIARGGEVKSSEMTVVDLSVVNGKWQITNISCSSGETAPIREFSFEREGFLLKSVPPPLNPDYWHIVFEENGQNGHTSPLFFGATSMCTSIDGVETVCDESKFKDATKVLVQGEMTESGVEVKKVTFIAE